MASTKCLVAALILVFGSAGTTWAQLDLLASPALAPALENLASNPTLLSQLTTTSLFSALGSAAYAPQVAELLQSKSFQDILDNPTTFSEVANSPILAEYVNAPAPELPGKITALANAAAETPTTGDPQTDLNNLVSALGLAPEVAATGRRMLRA